MKKNFKLLMLIAFAMHIPLHANAQGNKEQVRVYYAALFRECESDGTLEKDLQCLRIGKDVSHYYSVYSKGYFVDIENYEIRTSEKKGVTYQIIKNKPKEGMLMYSEGSGNKFTYTDGIPKLKWQMLKGDTIIDKYACKKAMTELNGRTWTVWYTLDIPYSNGPWKLGGLPGLIMDAHDKKGDFSFTFCGMEKGDGATIKEIDYSHGGSVYAVTPQRLQELTILLYKNLNKYHEELYGSSYNGRGKTMEDCDERPCLMEILPDTKKRKK